ncbi:MAG: hypothetical protein EBU73_09395 [Chitinophagia bacterium]|nr:hypothetical protein [Chitinophagia bacterium]
MKNYVPVFMIALLMVTSCAEKKEEVKSTTETSPKQETVIAEPVEPDSLTRLQQIKSMVQECDNVFKGKKSSCIDGKKTVSEEVNEGEAFSFDQTATKCKDVSGYELHTAYFNGHEWSNTVKIYLKNGIPFFVFSETYSEGFATESRYYFKTKGELLSVLVRENDGLKDCTRNQ